MPARYLFLAAGVLFLGATAIEAVRTQHHAAPLLDAAAGAIFLFLGLTSRKRR